MSRELGINPKTVAKWRKRATVEDLRHGISRLPDVEGDKPQRQEFKRNPIGFFQIDIAEVQTAEGKLFLFVGIDRTVKFAVAQLVATADRKTAWEFLQHMLEAVPYQVHRVLTDNGIQFAEQPGAGHHLLPADAL
jgi:IS30 family transposase